MNPREVTKHMLFDYYIEKGIYDYPKSRIGYPDMRAKFNRLNARQYCIEKRLQQQQSENQEQINRAAAEEDGIYYRDEIIELDDTGIESFKEMNDSNSEKVCPNFEEMNKIEESKDVIEFKEKVSESCPICYDSMEGNYTMLSCKHMFCTSCIMEYTQKHNKTCPICRSEISNVKPKIQTISMYDLEPTIRDARERKYFKSYNNVSSGLNDSIINNLRTYETVVKSSVIDEYEKIVEKQQILDNIIKNIDKFNEIINESILHYYNDQLD